MSRYNDNNPQHRKELHDYLTRPKADSKVHSGALLKQR